MFAFAVFSVVVSSRTLYFGQNASEEGVCTDSKGCMLNKLKEGIEVGDEIVLIDSLLSGQSCVDFLAVINASTSKNLSIRGAPTTFIDPGYPESDQAAVYLENSSISMSNLSFDGFHIPILNGQNSSFVLSHFEALNSVAIRSGIMSFIGCEIKSEFLTFTNSTTNTQNLIIALNSTFNAQNFNLTSNFMESKDVRAALHFISSQVNIHNATMNSNSMRLPLLASSNTTTFTLSDSNVSYNNLFSLFALEFNSMISIQRVNMNNNEGSLIAGGHTSNVVIDKFYVSNQKSNEALIPIIDSNVTITDFMLNSSDIACFVFSQSNRTMTFSNMSVTNTKSRLSLVSAEGGSVLVSNSVFNDIESEADVIAISHQSGVLTSVQKTVFNGLSSKSSVSTTIASMNTTDTVVESSLFEKNAACSLLFENSTVAVSSTNFTMNQCLPVGNSLPLAIITASLSNKLTIDNSSFRNNTAMTGSLFAMNVTASLNDNLFYGNTAVQGAAIFASGMNLSVSNVSFEHNSAMSWGGAASLSEGNATFTDCKFIGNTAPEGSSISVKKSNLLVKNSVSKMNHGDNSTFVHSEDSLVLIESCEVDDDMSKAIYSDKIELFTFKSAKFNCRIRCQEAKAQTPKVIKPKKEVRTQEPVKEQQPEDNEEDIIQRENETEFSIVWVSLPLTFIVAFLIYRKMGTRGLYMAARRFVGKNPKLSQ